MRYLTHYKLFESSSDDIYRDYFYDLIDDGVLYKRLNFKNTFIIYLDCDRELLKPIVSHINGVEDKKVVLSKNTIHSTGHGNKPYYTFIISEDIIEHFSILFSNIECVRKPYGGETCYIDSVRDLKVYYNLTRDDNQMSINGNLYAEFNKYFYNSKNMITMTTHEKYGYFAIIKLIIAEILEIKITEFSLSIETSNFRPKEKKKNWFKRLFEAEGSDMESPDLSVLRNLRDEDGFINMDIIKDVLSDVLDEHPYVLEFEKLGQANWMTYSDKKLFIPAYYIMFDNYFRSNNRFYEMIIRAIDYYYEETGHDIAFIQFGGKMFKDIKRVYFLRNDINQIDRLDSKFIEGALVIKRNKK